MRKNTAQVVVAVVWQPCWGGREPERSGGGVLRGGQGRVHQAKDVLERGGGGGGEGPV